MPVRLSESLQSFEKKIALQEEDNKNTTAIPDIARDYVGRDMRVEGRLVGIQGCGHVVLPTPPRRNGMEPGASRHGAVAHSSQRTRPRHGCSARRRAQG